MINEGGKPIDFLNIDNLRKKIEKNHIKGKAAKRDLF